MSCTAISSKAAVRRARALAALRRRLDDEGFIEITTPLLQVVRPFGPAPRHSFRVGDQEFHLRQSIELLLRTALTATPRVYDIGSAIRFEDAGRGPKSVVEFTLMELYAQNLEYDPLMTLAEQLIRATVNVPLPERRLVNVTQWFHEAGIDFSEDSVATCRRKMLTLLGVKEDDRPFWQLINSCIETFVEPKLEGFTFLHDYPLQTVCLARRSPARRHVIERFEVFINGTEVGHGFVDETNPNDVLARMEENGPEFVDRAFIDRLSSGEFPSSGGFGIGIERLLAMTDDSHSDVRQFLHEYQHG
ncbi:amino acid--tRNA ligase-related protein [Bradyrhizobium sp. HKCCYLRH1062]|uniref:amino acid--tRNA ligase-related protein n=1 Tax=unclassified Bradyrhizobium TaxID=2631580 RepID=UPI003EBAFE58